MMYTPTMTSTMPPPMPISAQCPLAGEPDRHGPGADQHQHRADQDASPHASTPAGPRRRAGPPSGAIREARRAGSSAATAVTPTPMTYDQNTAGQVIGNVGPAQVQPEHAEEPAQPEREQVADAQTDRRPDQPHGRRLEQHRPVDLPARGAHGAQQRELPAALGDQDREGVDDDEHPHERATTAAKTSRKVCRNPRISSRLSLFFST